MIKIFKNWLLGKLLSQGEHLLILTLREHPSKMEFVNDTLDYTDWQQKIAMTFPRCAKDMIERFRTVMEWDGTRWARARWGADLGDRNFGHAARVAEMNPFYVERLIKSYDRHHKKKGGE